MVLCTGLLHHGGTPLRVSVHPPTASNAYTFTVSGQSGGLVMASGNFLFELTYPFEQVI